MAMLPSLADIWHWLVLDSFPMLFPTLLHGLMAAGLDGSDFEFRVLGFLFGIGLLGAVWFAGRCLGLRVPLIALGLFAVNLTVIRWGDSLRAYGCGSAFILLTLGLVWRQMELPGSGRWLLAALAALLSVQTIYMNAFLLLAICGAGAGVGLLRRQFKIAASVIAIGIPAACSLLPYIRPVANSQDAYLLEKVDVNPGVVWSTFGQALDVSLGQVQWVWLLLVLFAVAAGMKFFARSKEARRINRDDVVLFAAMVLPAVCVAFFAYLKLSGLCKPWYFIPFMGLTAICADAALGSLAEKFRGWRIALVFLLAFAPYPVAVQSAKCAMTNMDAVAAGLQSRAQSGDLIVVYPWYCGISFGRYFKGGTAWTTLPDISDHRFHRYDLAREKIRDDSAVQPVLDRIRQTLISGGRVWIVGQLPKLPRDETSPPSRSPGLLSKVSNGWWEPYHSRFWGRQTAFFIRSHAITERPVQISLIGGATSVSELEDISVFLVSGWRADKF